MEPFAAVRSAAPPSFCLSSAPAVLSQAMRPGVDVAVWMRTVPGFVRATLAQMGTLRAAVRRPPRAAGGGDRSRHESATSGGAVHRSPPIEDRGALRVALVVTAGGEVSS